MTLPSRSPTPAQINQAARESPQRALELAELWTKAEPQQPRAWSKLAHIHLLARRHPQAALAARAAVDLAPRAPELWFKLGMALSLARDPEGAGGAFERCASLGELIEDHFYTDSARVAHARCLLELGRPREALAPLLAAHPQASVWVGELLTAASLLARARALCAA